MSSRVTSSHLLARRVPSLPQSIPSWTAPLITKTTSPPASASYGSIHSAEQYSSYLQPPSVWTTYDAHSVAGMGLPPQVLGSIGPDRVTRRTRTHLSLHLGIRRDCPSQPDLQTGQPGNEKVRPLSVSWWWINFTPFFLSTSHNILPNACPPPVPCRHQPIAWILRAISSRQTGSMYSITPSGGSGSMPMQSLRNSLSAYACIWLSVFSVFTLSREFLFCVLLLLQSTLGITGPDDCSILSPSISFHDVRIYPT